MGRKSNTAPTEFKQAVGGVLKQIRKEHQVTQTELADRIGAAHASAISDLERGKFEPYLYVFFQICGALGEKPVSVLRKIEEVVRKESSD